MLSAASDSVFCARWIGSPRRDDAILFAGGADIRQLSRNNLVNALSCLCQGYGTPGDNAFHLGSGASCRQAIPMNATPKLFSL